ncbi:MAG: hypothetical protein ABIR56_05735, partial [Polaromonas sp.]
TSRVPFVYAGTFLCEIWVRFCVNERRFVMVFLIFSWHSPKIIVIISWQNPAVKTTPCQPRLKNTNADKDLRTSPLADPVAAAGPTRHPAWAGHGGRDRFAAPPAALGYAPHPTHC